MKTKMEPYAYFQPGEIFYFISHESDKPINRTTGVSKRDKPINAESSSLENEEPIDPEIGGLESDQSSDAEYNDDDDDNDGDDNGDLSYDQKIDRLIDWSNKVAKEFKKEFQLQYDITISRDKKRELHFPGTLQEEPAKSEIMEFKSEGDATHKIPKPTPHGAFSLIPAQIRISDDDERWKKSEYEKNPARYVERSELANLVVGLDDHRNDDAQPLKKQGITIEAISPNWLSSPCSEYGGGGGPGGFPEPHQDISTTSHAFGFPRQQKFRAILGSAADISTEVTVAILDTSPCLKDLAAAYERHCKVNPVNQNLLEKEQDQLIQSLLKPNGPLVVHPASLEELLRMRAVHLRDHNYDMTDHGLFIAGTIHRLAPKAKIHLYEVLNHQGVGDLLSIARGFWRVFICFSREPLVVNCSIALNIPLLNQPIKDLDPAFLAKITKPGITLEERLTEKTLNQDPSQDVGLKWLARQGRAIEWICDHLYFRGSRVIAAAGNDRRSEENNNIRPQARYPAAFDSALGVGALPKGAVRDSHGQYPTASYSDISDQPGEVGVVTLGGEQGAKNGVLGLYIGEFPDMWYRLQQYPCFLWPLMWLIFTISWGNCVRPKNKTDWAWWCGTSFATPIVAGLVAASLSELRLHRPATTQDAVNDLYIPRGQGILSTQTVDLEDGIGEVTQD